MSGTGDGGADVAAIVDEATDAFAVLGATGTLTASATLSFVVRAGDGLVAVKHPDPFRPGSRPDVAVTPLHGEPGPALRLGDGPRYAAVFRAHPEITVVAHVHAPHLGAWSQTHRPLPLTYVPVQRATLAAEVPVYVDRRQGEDAFILDTLAADPDVPAILEANGGATVWGPGSLTDLARFVLLLEEGARLLVLAELVGGARDFGPGVLAQQWSFTGLAGTPRGRARIAAAEAAHAGIGGAAS